MISTWDYSQWTYVSIVVLGLYFVCLSFVWLKEKGFRADPFFYYIVFMILGAVVSRFGLAIARHFMLIEDTGTRDLIISSWWWGLKSLIPVLTLAIINIHATYRYLKVKGK